MPERRNIRVHFWRSVKPNFELLGGLFHRYNVFAQDDAL